MKAFEGKVVLVTGGSKGIGLACAKQFAAEGGRVAISSRSRDNIRKALAELPGAAGFPANLSDDREAADMVRHVEQEVGAIDVLVNCAGAPDARRPTISPRLSGARRWTPNIFRPSMSWIRW